MSTLTEIEAAAEALPAEQLRQLLDRLAAKLEHLGSGKEGPPNTYEVLTGEDGLPLIRGTGGVITSEMVREIEGLAP
jgi:hypothetical protein